MTESPRGVAQDFIYTANAIFGLYLDTSMAVGNLGRSYIEYHERHLEELAKAHGPLSDERINPVVVYTAGSQEQPRPLHQTTIADLIERNGPEGRHMRFLAQMCVVALYQFWEDSFRPRLGKALGVDGDSLKHDALGELRHLRRSIIHRGGKAVPELATTRFVPSFPVDTDVILDYEGLERIVTSVKTAVEALAGR